MSVLTSICPFIRLYAHTQTLVVFSVEPRKIVGRALASSLAKLSLLLPLSYATSTASREYETPQLAGHAASHWSSPPRGQRSRRVLRRVPLYLYVTM